MPFDATHTAPEFILRIARADFSKVRVTADDLSAEALAALAETGHFRDATHWYEAPQIEDVFAEHGQGWDREGRQTAFTRLTKRALYADGGTFIANRAGHLPNNHIVKFGHHSSAYRLVLVGAEAARVAA